MEFCAFENAAKGLVIRSLLRPHAQTLTLLIGGGQASVAFFSVWGVSSDGSSGVFSFHAVVFVLTCHARIAFFFRRRFTQAFALTSCHAADGCRVRPWASWVIVLQIWLSGLTV